MTRNEFIKKSAVLGAGLPFLSLLSSCTREANILNPIIETDFSGKVLIIGAGSAGMTAGYLLARNNIEFQILEAAGDYGGRVKRADNFADFPIDIGAEWIHEEPEILSEILTNQEVSGNVDVVVYNPPNHFSLE